MKSLTTLVSGASAARRESAIGAALAPALSTTVLFEGLASASDALCAESGAVWLQVVRIASGCLCCSGNLTMRVTLNRILRQRPARLYISLASSEHLPRILALLAAPPYSDWLSLTEPITCAD